MEIKNLAQELFLIRLYKLDREDWTPARVKHEASKGIWEAHAFEKEFEAGNLAPNHRSTNLADLKEKITGQLVFEAVTRSTVGHAGKWFDATAQVQIHYESIAKFMRDAIE